MAYRPYTFTTTAAAQRAVTWDPKRTNLVITNVSGETCYLGADVSVSNTGVTSGAPIFNNSRFQANFRDGTDPTLERWLIGTAGGTIIIFEEFAKDPYVTAMESLTAAIQQLIGAHKP